MGFEGVTEHSGRYTGDLRGMWRVVTGRNGHGHEREPARHGMAVQTVPELKLNLVSSSATIHVPVGQAIDMPGVRS